MGGGALGKLPGSRIPAGSEGRDVPAAFSCFSCCFAGVYSHFGGSSTSGGPSRRPQTGIIWEKGQGSPQDSLGRRIWRGCRHRDQTQLSLSREFFPWLRAGIAPSIPLLAPRAASPGIPAAPVPRRAGIQVSELSSAVPRDQGSGWRGFSRGFSRGLARKGFPGALRDGFPWINPSLCRAGSSRWENTPQISRAWEKIFLLGEGLVELFPFVKWSPGRNSCCSFHSCSHTKTFSVTWECQPRGTGIMPQGQLVPSQLSQGSGSSWGGMP